MRDRHQFPATRNRRTLAFFAMLFPFLLLSGNVAAGDLTSRLLGTWEGEGKLFGQAATFRMNWESVLDGRFIRLTFQNRIEGSNGNPRVLEAQAFYRASGDDRLEGTWFDSRGMVLPLQARCDDTSLTTLWGSPDTERGRTEYLLLSDDRVEVKDFVLKGETWTEFGHAVYVRTSASDR